MIKNLNIDFNPFCFTIKISFVNKSIPILLPQQLQHQFPILLQILTNILRYFFRSFRITPIFLLTLLQTRNIALSQNTSNRFRLPKVITLRNYQVPFPIISVCIWSHHTVVCLVLVWGWFWVRYFVRSYLRQLEVFRLLLSSNFFY